MNNLLQHISDIQQRFPKDFRKQWGAILLSGKYTQGKNLLYFKEDDTFCCLGVLL